MNTHRSSSHSSYPKLRLYVESSLAEGDDVVLDEAAAHYALSVMRAKPGDALALFNGRDGEWRAVITAAHKRSAALRCEALLRAQTSGPDMWLVCAAIKHQAMDWMVEKACELGARRIIPVTTARSQVTRLNTDKLRLRAIEAAQQCERLEVSEIAELTTLSALLAQWPKDRLLVFGDERGGGESAARVLANHAPKAWAVCVGPEGGFSGAERAQLSTAPYAVAAGLGPRILRAETAAVTLLALTAAQWGDWHQRPAFRATEEAHE